MTNIEKIAALVPELESRESVKLGHLMRQRQILLSMEKSAAVEAKISDKEQEIAESFYKSANFLRPMMQGAKVLYNSGKAALTRGATGGYNAWKSGQGVGASLGGAMRGASRAFNQGGGAQLVRNNAGKFMAGSAAAGYMMGNRGSQPQPQQQPQNNIYMTRYAEDENFSKLASVVSLNFKLKEALNSNISKEAKDLALEMIRENNSHCAELLEKVSTGILGSLSVPGVENMKKAMRGPLAGMGDKIGTAIGNAASAAGKVATNFVSPGPTTAESITAAAKKASGK